MQFKTYDEAVEHLFPIQLKEEKKKRRKTIKEVIEETAKKIMERL